jgi:hypothetical protein
MSALTRNKRSRFIIFSQDVAEIHLRNPDIQWPINVNIPTTLQRLDGHLNE